MILKIMKWKWWFEQTYEVHTLKIHMQKQNKKRKFFSSSRFWTLDFLDGSSLLYLLDELGRKNIARKKSQIFWFQKFNKVGQRTPEYSLGRGYRYHILRCIQNWFLRWLLWTSVPTMIWSWCGNLPLFYFKHNISGSSMI